MLPAGACLCAPARLMSRPYYYSGRPAFGWSATGDTRFAAASERAATANLARQPSLSKAGVMLSEFTPRGSNEYVVLPRPPLNPDALMAVLDQIKAKGIWEKSALPVKYRVTQWICAKRTWALLHHPLGRSAGGR